VLTILINVEREKARTINRELCLNDYVKRVLIRLRPQGNCANSELVPYFENVLKAINQESTNYTAIIVKLSSTNLKNDAVHCSRIFLNFFDTASCESIISGHHRLILQN